MNSKWVILCHQRCFPHILLNQRKEGICFPVYRQKGHWIWYIRHPDQRMHQYVFVQPMSVLSVSQSEALTMWEAEMKIRAKVRPHQLPLTCIPQGWHSSWALAEGRFSLFSFLIPITRSSCLTLNWLWQHVLFPWISSQLFFLSSVS